MENFVKQNNDGIHPNAIISEDIKLGKNISIAPYVVIEKGVQIGDSVQIGSGSFIGTNTTIGDKTIINANVSIYHNIMHHDYTQLSRTYLIVSTIQIPPQCLCLFNAC